MRPSSPPPPASPATGWRPSSPRTRARPRRLRGSSASSTRSCPLLLTAEAALRDGAPPVHPGGNLVHEFDVVAGDEVPAQQDGPRPHGHRLDAAHPPRRPRAARLHRRLRRDRQADHLERDAERVRRAHGGRGPARLCSTTACASSRCRWAAPSAASRSSSSSRSPRFSPMRLGRPVRLAFDRQECIYATMVRGGHVHSPDADCGRRTATLRELEADHAVRRRRVREQFAGLRRDDGAQGRSAVPRAAIPPPWPRRPTPPRRSPAAPAAYGRPGDLRGHGDRTWTCWRASCGADPVDLRLRESGPAARRGPALRPVARRRAGARVPRRAAPRRSAGASA